MVSRKETVNCRLDTPYICDVGHKLKLILKSNSQTITTILKNAKCAQYITPINLWNASSQCENT